MFALPPTRPGADYRARIFTPRAELPFAGHPSVGVAWVLCRDGAIAAGEAVQECGAGLLPVAVDAIGARITGGAPWVGPDVVGPPLAAAAGLVAADLDPRLAPGVAGAGLAFTFLPVHPDALARAHVPELAALRDGTPHPELAVVAVDPAGAHAHVRVFAPGLGVPEDPATGSAAVALAVFLRARGALPAEGSSAFLVEQGIELGRPSRLDVRVRARGGRVVETTVGGGVVPVAAGEIRVPPSGTSA